MHGLVVIKLLLYLGKIICSDVISCMHDFLYVCLIQPFEAAKIQQTVCSWKGKRCSLVLKSHHYPFYKLPDTAINSLISRVSRERRECMVRRGRARLNAPEFSPSDVDVSPAGH